jgi:uncharacterized sporulation protein YeaH/YhbH (DUF444 family)
MQAFKIKDGFVDTGRHSQKYGFIKINDQLSDEVVKELLTEGIDCFEVVEVKIEEVKEPTKKENGKGKNQN